MPGSDVAAVRRAVDAEVRGRTLCDLYTRNAARHGVLPAISFQDGGWRTLSWAECREVVGDVAVGLAELGVGQGDAVAIALPNRSEHLLADGGALHARATPVSVPLTLEGEALAAVATRSGTRVAVVEGGAHLERWLAVRDACPSLEHLVVVGAERGHPDRGLLAWDDLRLRGRAARLADPERFETVAAGVEPDDPATIVYAPERGAAPQGVVLTHRNVLWALTSLERFVALPAHPRTVGHLPLAGVDARLFGHYLPLQAAGVVSCCPEPTRLADALHAARPQVFLGAPPTWEQLQARVHARAGDDGASRTRDLALAAFAAGRKVVRYEQEGLVPPLPLRLRRPAFERLVYAPARQDLGLDECAFAASAGPPLAVDVIEFFGGLGVPVHEVYGRAETTGVTHANRPGALRIGTVGQALPGVEQRLAADGELIVRGGNVMAGYHGDEAVTGEVVDEDGWLHTGDVGVLDASGYLTLTGRKEDRGAAADESSNAGLE